MKNRWLVVLGALIIQISLGAVYIYSVFKTPLQQMFGWDKSQVAIPAQIVLVCGIGSTTWQRPPGRCRMKNSTRSTGLTMR